MKKVLFDTPAHRLFSLSYDETPPQYYTIINIKKFIAKHLNYDSNNLMCSFQGNLLNDNSLISMLNLKNRSKICVSLKTNENITIPNDFFGFSPHNSVIINDDDLKSIHDDDSIQCLPKEIQIKDETVKIIFAKYGITLISLLQQPVLINLIEKHCKDPYKFIQNMVQNIDDKNLFLSSELENAFYQDEIISILPSINNEIQSTDPELRKNLATFAPTEEENRVVNEKNRDQELELKFKFVKSLVNKQTNDDDHIQSQILSHEQSIDKMIEGIKICRNNGLLDVLKFTGIDFN